MCIGYNNQAPEEEEDEPPPQFEPDSDHESEHEPLANLISNFSRLGEDDDDLPEAFAPDLDRIVLKNCR